MKIPNMIIKRYRDNVDWVRPALKREPFDRLQEIEGLFRKYGARYGFDWLLLASFAYQESRLDQRARSPVGAVGIMQVLPSTAQDRRVGIKDIEIEKIVIFQPFPSPDINPSDIIDDKNMKCRMIFRNFCI